MENRANHALVGAIALALIGVFLAVLYWLGGAGAGRAGRAYVIHFQGPVTGLSSASKVLFNGLPVGRVERLALSKEEVGKVAVVVSVDPQTPVRADSRARIVRSGLTGLAQVLITPGSREAPLLAPEADGRPVPIAAEGGGASGPFDAAARAMERSRQAFDRLDRLLAQNERAVSNTLANFEAFSSALAESKDDLHAIVRDTRAIAARFDTLSAKLAGVMEKIDGLLGPENAGALITEAREAAAGFRALAEKLEGSLGAQSGQLTRTAKRSFNEFELFMKEGRRAIRKLESVLKSIERNPSRLIFGGRLDKDEDTP